MHTLYFILFHLNGSILKDIKDWKELLFEIADHNKFKTSLYHDRVPMLAAIQMTSIYFQMEEMRIKDQFFFKILAVRGKSKEYFKFITKANQIFLNFIKSLDPKKVKENMIEISPMIKLLIGKISSNNDEFNRLNKILDNVIYFKFKERTAKEAYNILIKEIESCNLSSANKEALKYRAERLWWFSTTTKPFTKDSEEEICNLIKL